MNTIIPFNKHFVFDYESIEQISPLVRRVVAQNPNFFTFYGTNTYIVGNGEVALIDPGPDDPEHIRAIKNGLAGETITHILVTHTHYDHWPAYLELQRVFGAKTYGYFSRAQKKPNPAHQSPEERSLNTQERFEITGFIPDISLENGDVIQGDGWTIEALFTPGHASDHICYYLREENALFSGDHVMGWSTSVISPPSGNMQRYMENLDLLLQRNDRVYWPAHGPAIEEPRPYVQSFIAHRQEREEQILDQLKKGRNTIPEMVSYIYQDVPHHLHPAAERSTFAAILYMIEKGTVKCLESPTAYSRYELT